MVIYKIKNVITNDCYIGSSCNFLKRKYEHFRRLEKNKHHSIILQRAYNKYGKENFIVEIIKDNLNNNQELLFWEQYFINNLSPKYNINPTAGNRKGAKVSQETKEKLRLHNLGKKLSQETKEKISKIHLGQKRNDETKLKMSLAQLGSKNHNFGKKWSEERKKKRSKETSGIKSYSFGKKLSQETKEKISKSLKGKKSTFESNLKKSNSCKHKKSVICIDTNEIFDSLKSASKKINVARCRISQAIKKGHKIKGLTFKYMENK
jgi:group I intron endonuclease